MTRPGAAVLAVTLTVLAACSDLKPTTLAAASRSSVAAPVATTTTTDTTSATSAIAFP